MSWTVIYTAKARRGVNKLPAAMRTRFMALVAALEVEGPVQPKMPNFGKLKNWPGDVYHCHLNKGRPRYVAVWRVEDGMLCMMEVIYVGTHENAPY